MSADLPSPHVARPGLVPIRETVYDLAARARARAAPPFEPDSSPWHGRAIFVVGAPRSGTTWLHQLLLTHPDIATGGEMHVFCEGLGALFANFEDPDPYMHLSTWLSRSELVSLCRNLVDGVFTAAAVATRPRASWVLDKTPNHGRCARLLAETYPDATFVQIVRDPRDVLSSARDLWGQWSPRSRVWADAAVDWNAVVSDCREHLGSHRYHELRYEDLLAAPAERLAEVLDLADVPYDERYLRETVEFGRAPINVRPSDPRLSARKWSDLDPLAEREIIEVAGDLMIDLGYLTPGQRTEALRRRSIRLSAMRSARGMRTLTHKARRRAGGLAKQRVVGSRQQSGQVMRVATQFATAAADPDSFRFDQLSPDVLAVLPNGDTTVGADQVGGLLRALLVGARLRPVMADASAAGVEVILADGARQYHRYFVEGEMITKVQVS